VANKYDKLVNKLNYRAGRGGANARELVFVSGEELGGFELNFIVGVYDTVGDWAPNRGAHTHTFDELLLFFGYDPQDMNYLGADLSICVGPEYEKHYLSKPSVVAAPAGSAHCPLVTEKVDNRFGHFHLALSATYSGAQCPQEGTTDGHKYDGVFHDMAAVKGPGGADAVQSVHWDGKDLEGFPVNFTMSLHNAAGKFQKGPHVHPYDEVYIFFGHRTDELGYLGAEISIELGEEREKHTFDVPTVVSIPRGLPHFPLTCNRVDAPYRLMNVGLAPVYKDEKA
jgi:hypothetical protein